MPQLTVHLYIPKIKVTRYILDNERNNWSYLILILVFVAQNWDECYNTIKCGQTLIRYR